MGAAFDLLGMLCRHAWMRNAGDLFLGVFGAAGVIAAALVLRCEAFRMYTLLGVASGWVIYAVTLGWIVRILRRKFMKLSKKVINSAKDVKIMQEN